MYKLKVAYIDEIKMMEYTQGDSQVLRNCNCSLFYKI